MKNEEWDIKERSKACMACSRPFADQEGLFSKLEHGAEGYTRADYCEPCWPTVDKSRALSIWRSVFRPPPPPPEEPLKKETAESLLRRLVETENPANRNTIYILAVMLERRRVLIEKDVQTREDGIKVRVYEHRHTGDVFLIPDPELRLDELEHVQKEVVAMLGGEEKAEEVSGQSSEVSDQRSEVSGPSSSPPSDL